MCRALNNSDLLSFNVLPTIALIFLVFCPVMWRIFVYRLCKDDIPAEKLIFIFRMRQEASYLQ
jgi:hypothetical protein